MDASAQWAHSCWDGPGSVLLFEVLLAYGLVQEGSCMLDCYLDSSSSGYAVASCLVLLGWEVLIAARRTHVLILCDVLGSSFAVCWLRVALVVTRCQAAIEASLLQEAAQVVLASKYPRCNSIIFAITGQQLCRAALAVSSRHTGQPAEQIMLVSNFHVYSDICVSWAA